MNNNVLLGALPVVDAQVSSGGGIVSSPIDIVTLPTDSPAGSGFNVVATGPTGGGVNYMEGGPAGGGGGMTFPTTDQPAPLPPDRRQDAFYSNGGTEGDGPKPMSKKNMMLIGIGALVLGYLIFRKK